MASAQAGHIAEAEADLTRIPEWGAFTAEEKQKVFAELQELPVKVSEDIAGLKLLLSSQFDITTTIQDLKRRIIDEGKERRKPPIPIPGDPPKPRQRRPLLIPAKIATTDELDALIKRLQELRGDALYYEYDVKIGEE